MSETKQQSHYMPFGAELREDGLVRFQLWAPAAQRVEVYLNVPATGSERLPSLSEAILLPMEAKPGGWFSIITELACVGSLYYFRIDEDVLVPDPASRFQPGDVHGPSEVVDPAAWAWRNPGWCGRPWEEAIIYELHVGCFTREGNFAAAMDKLDYLVELGITAIELMPVADFPGSRNWGYDGAYPFAPDNQYGRPDDLKALIDAAHGRGLMVYLDVVYNHFGPEGNYLMHYAPQFFSDRHETPWGAGINYDGNDSEPVRQFFIHNALFWLEEYHLDGLRLDAVHTMTDDSTPDILTDLAQRIRSHFGGSRHIHLILENDHNAAHFLPRDRDARPQFYNAQWNDDFHHVLHLLLTGESTGYYIDYTHEPVQLLGRCLTEGFAYQGEPSAYRGERRRGEPSSHLPASAFVSFLQNHDQVGNRAFGERIASLASPEQLRAATVLLRLAPSTPLLFMGEEWGCIQPFTFFCDFGPELAKSVITGRQQEFARFAQFSAPESRECIPNPMAPETFNRSVLDWAACDLKEHTHWLELNRELNAVRQQELIPRLDKMAGHQKPFLKLGDRTLAASWVLGDGSELFLIANLDSQGIAGIKWPPGKILYATHNALTGKHGDVELPPWSVVWLLKAGGTSA
ncbi:malto-oligosyltrehalose trehalohydrolase [Marinobacter sp.]|uniref:malto-oligosyltrehalose trehalohydrolase n=1 Tax=Marinobacter sp. TaxID=50741 RepID=UPI003A92AABC